MNSFVSDAAIGGAAEALRREAAEEMRRLALAAGEATLPFFRGEAELNAQTKSDSSPVTAADQAADALIVDGLAAAYPDVPIVTEERADSHANDPGDFFFLVDPLDGTKEFLSGSGEFTVNIALIEQGAPTLGVVYAPAMGRLFWTPDPDFAVEEREEDGQWGVRRQLWTAQAENDALRIVASKSHRDAATDAYISRYQTGAIESAGSSLKFCLIASGDADLYPRFGPTMGWDTAAAHAVLRASGGHVRAIGLDGEPAGPLRYGPRSLIELFGDPEQAGDNALAIREAMAQLAGGGAAFANPHFIAYAGSVTLR